MKATMNRMAYFAFALGASAGPILQRQNDVAGSSVPTPPSFPTGGSDFPVGSGFPSAIPTGFPSHPIGTPAFPTGISGIPEGSAFPAAGTGTPRPHGGPGFGPGRGRNETRGGNSDQLLPRQNGRPGFSAPSEFSAIPTQGSALRPTGSGVPGRHGGAGFGHNQGGNRTEEGNPSDASVSGRRGHNSISSAVSVTRTRFQPTATNEGSIATEVATAEDDDDSSEDDSEDATSPTTTASSSEPTDDALENDNSSKEASTSSASAPATTTAPSSSSSNGVSAGSLPASSGTSVLSAVQTIAAGESFDGGMVMFDRGVECTGQTEGGGSDAVFILENGASLSNVIIGPNQIEGVHCNGACTLTNVWWSAVCEDAFSVKKQDAGETTYVNGGGAFGASDKVVQHNGAGTVSISDFTVEEFGKLYRSCGNCDSMYERHVIMDGISATSGSVLAGINSNYGDTATITNSVANDVDDVCTQFEGTDDNDEEPVKIGSGADGTYCIYGSDVIVS